MITLEKINMTKKELIKAMADFDDDQVVILAHHAGGFANIEEVHSDGVCIKLEMGDHPLSDRD